MTEAERLRKELGLTRKELATLLGVSSRTIEGWEQKRFKPNPSTIKLLQHLADDIKLLQRFAGVKASPKPKS